jgi:signal peptidase I
MAFAEQGFFYRLAVPSWPQFHAGERVRGHLYLWTFLALLLPACLFFGTRTGSVLVGLAYSMHTTGALDAVMVNFADGSFADRLARSFVVSIALGIFVYLPAAWGLSYVAAAHVVQRPLGPFEVGDVIMVNSLESARPGRVVLYEMPEYVYTIDDTPHHRIIRRFGGEAIERVIAGPGDLVEFESNRVSVNGSPLPYSPLGGVIGPSSLKVMVPDNSCLILPPAGVEPRPADADAWRHVSVVPLSSVRGVVFARTSPPKKWMLVH